MRVPVSWCWTNHDPSELVTAAGDDDTLIYMADEEVREKYTCRDPFHEGISWPAGE